MRATADEIARVQKEVSSMNSTFRAESNARIAPILICESACYRGRYARSNYLKDWHVIYALPFGSSSGNVPKQRIDAGTLLLHYTLANADSY